VRKRFEARFEPEIAWGRNRFCWLGTHHLFGGLTLTFRAHKTCVYSAHSYKFCDDISTFIAECDEATWRAAGFESMSEPETCATLQEVFSTDLGGQALLTNDFLRWRQFPVISNGRWSHEHVVLLGDALHTAHFSIGSGTKLAVEDSIALHAAFSSVAGASSVAAALAEFERGRRPVVESLQTAALESQAWFETARERMDIEPIDMAWRCMTRSGRVDVEKMRQRDPAFVARYEQWKSSQGG
jgi:anthraniloyl-CoA monooxygenase